MKVWTIGKRVDNSNTVIRVDKKYFRPCEVDKLLGDSTKAHQKLGWSPKTSLEDLVSDMVQNDMKLARKESLLVKKGFHK